MNLFKSDKFLLEILGGIFNLKLFGDILIPLLNSGLARYGILFMTNRYCDLLTNGLFLRVSPSLTVFQNSSYDIPILFIS